MARTADFQRIVTEEISVELADGVSSIQVKERLDDLPPPMKHFDEIKDTTGKVLATVVWWDNDEGS